MSFEKMKTGLGFDAHRFAPNRRLVLGGVEIVHDQGLLGHSDADVLVHAVMDALLGAIADGDIGQHFSDKDPQWKDADSIVLLQHVVKRVHAKGYAIVNIDSTVMAEVPRLAPHIVAMRERMSTAMGISADDVSVKATTVETMGAIGRREGIAAMAIAMVRKI